MHLSHLQYNLLGSLYSLLGGNRVVESIRQDLFEMIINSFRIEVKETSTYYKWHQKTERHRAKNIYTLF